MERSRRGDIPSSSRLTVRKKGNRKRAGSWTQNLPSPKGAAIACGRLVRRALPATIVATIAVGFVALGWFGYGFVTSSPRFAIASIEIRQTGARVPVEAIRAALPIHVGDNTFRADFEAARAAVAQNPWIASVEIERVIPHTVIVKVTERTPVAVVAFDSELYLVEANGHAFKRATSDESAGLPIVTGLARDAYRGAPELVAEQIRDALAALDAWRAVATRPAIGEVHLDHHGELVLATYEHATSIRLGALPGSSSNVSGSDLAARMTTFDAAWAELTADERARTRAIRLDTRTDHVTVAFAKD